jgi:hypothetical protein
VSVARRLADRFFGSGAPRDWTGTLSADENVIAHGELRGGGYLVATSLGLWLPGDSSDSSGPRRVGWHLISKATWANGELVVIEAHETGTAGEAVLLADRAPRRYVLETPGKLPETVHRRVTGSIRSRHHRELPGGGAWFVQRKVPGRDGILLQVRPDDGADRAAVSKIAAEVALRIRDAVVE